MKNIKIVLNINGKDHSMTYDEAKKLYQELNEIFGPRDTIPFIPEPYYDKIPWYPRTDPNTVPIWPDITYCLNRDFNMPVDNAGIMTRLKE